MTVAWALVSTEAIKLRRTLALWLVLVTPALVCTIELISLFNLERLPMGTGSEIWRALLLSGWLWWLALIVPMLISFEAASLANLEHGGKLWKQLHTFPIRRWSVYATKMLFCGLLVGASFLVLVLGFVGGVLIFSGISGLHLASSIPWVEIVTMAGKAYLASWMMMAIQTWFSMRFSGVAAAGIGFASLVAGFILLGIVARHGEMFSSLSSCYPWMLAFRTLSLGPRDLHSTSLPAVFGCVGGVLVGALACWDLARRREGE